MRWLALLPSAAGAVGSVIAIALGAFFFIGLALDIEQPRWMPVAALAGYALLYAVGAAVFIGSMWLGRWALS